MVFKFCSFISAGGIFISDQVRNNWREGMEFCSETPNGYYLGNVNLSDVHSSCTGLKHSGPGWIGVIKENFVKSDQGNKIIIEGISKVKHDLCFD